MPPVATGFPNLLRILRPLIAAVLLAAMPAAAAAGRATWSVEVTPDGELFPVLDLSQAKPRSTTPGGGNGLVIVRVHAGAAARHVRVRVDTPGLREPAVAEADLARGASLTLRPRLDWDVDWLRGLAAPIRQSLRITIEGAGREPESRDVPVRVHPLDDALYYVREGDARIDLGWVFAAYVDPQDPVVDTVVAAARAEDADFDAPADDAQAIRAKLRAVWIALARHGLRYAEGDPALSRGPSAYSQRVRLLEDVWRERRANCIDGSVLIASVLERIGVRAYIALVPGHAFVGYRAGTGRIEFLETTLLGRHAPGPREAPASAAAIGADFDAALRAGGARWQRSASRFDRRHAPDYALIDIGTARSYGIIPLGAHGDGRRGERRAVRTAAGSLRPNHPP
jgi:hypothetical protein